jgi:hypothetical protein
MRNRIVINILAAAVLLLSSCYPKTYLPKPKEYLSDVKGSYITVVMKSRSHITHEGEIIAVDKEHLILLSVSRWDTTTVIHKEEVQSAQILLARTSDDPEKIGTWAGLMNLMTLAHGYFMVFTVPMNIIASIATATGASNSNYRIHYPDEIKWDDISKFARFPQGMPKGVEVKDLD